MGALCYHKAAWWHARRKCSWTYRHHRRQQCVKDECCNTKGAGGTRPGPGEKRFGQQEAYSSSFACNGPKQWCKAAWAGQTAGFVGMLAKVGCRVSNQLFIASVHHQPLLPAAATSDTAAHAAIPATVADVNPLSGPAKPNLFPHACLNVLGTAEPKAFQESFEWQAGDRVGLDLFSDARLSVLSQTSPSLRAVFGRGAAASGVADLLWAGVLSGSLPLRSSTSSPQLHSFREPVESPAPAPSPEEVQMVLPAEDLPPFRPEEILTSVEAVAAQQQELQWLPVGAQVLSEERLKALPSGPGPPSLPPPEPPMEHSRTKAPLPEADIGPCVPGGQSTAVLEQVEVSSPSATSLAPTAATARGPTWLSPLRPPRFSPAAGRCAGPKRRAPSPSPPWPLSPSSFLPGSSPGGDLSRRRLDLVPPISRVSPPPHPLREEGGVEKISAAPAEPSAAPSPRHQQQEEEGREKDPLPAPPSRPRRVSMDLQSVPVLSSQDMEVKKLLGSGSYGSVFQMKPCDEVGFTAMKVIRGLTLGPGGAIVPDSKRLAFEEEWEACRRLRHRNIVRFERVFWYLTSPEVSAELYVAPGEHSLCIEMEYCSLGSLEKLMHTARTIQADSSTANGPPSVATAHTMHRKHAGKFANRPDVRLSIARQVAAALDHMHSKGLIHRDLRPTNVVLDIGMIDSPDGTTGHGLVAKVCDFGACRAMGTSGPAGSRSGSEDVISPKYQAPEVLLSNDYSPKSDVYSFGVLLWELVAMREAWEDATDAYVIMNVPLVGPKRAGLEWPSSPETSLFCSDAVQALVDRCWEHDPSKRPTMKEVMAELKQISLEETSHMRLTRRSSASSPTAVGDPSSAHLHSPLPAAASPSPRPQMEPPSPQGSLPATPLPSSSATTRAVEAQPPPSRSAPADLCSPFTAHLGATADLMSPFQTEELPAAMMAAGATPQGAAAWV
mmetsp:Transcript_37332/g.105327  ORF Transcript_37332/g.105327 Transcript_37332/m.105327 type:complete len:949 (-) Transcript_37332:331-3177(-)